MKEYKTKREFVLVAIHGNIGTLSRNAGRTDTGESP